MKGIAHFMSGVTAASFCPWAVEAAHNGNPAFFILGAIAGILPNTIDFKFYRFFYRHDISVEPHPKTLDPQPIAEAFAAAVLEAATTGRFVRLKLCTIQTSADNWRQYRVRINPDAGAVRVQFGPIVSTGQVPQPGTLPANRSVGRANFSAPILQPYEPTYTVDIFDGPSFGFTRNEAGLVEIDFLPWHRSWSHSVTLGALLAGWASLWSWQAGVILFCAHAAHIVEDQLGYMGTNLFFPFTRQRTPGFKLMHSGDALPNFGCVWLCGLLLFWNLYAASAHPLYHFSLLRLILIALVIPFSIFGAMRWLLTRADGDPHEAVATEWNL